MPFVSTSRNSSPTDICSHPPKIDLWEPYDRRLSRTVLREPGGEIPVTLYLATGWWLLAAGTGMTYFPCR